MNRRDFLKTASVAAVALSGLGMADPSATKKPNILFFFVDDMGWQDSNVPFWEQVTALNKQYYTPNLITLAEQGMKFTQAYACAVCSPSRVSLMTGMNAARHRVTNWTLQKNSSPDTLKQWRNPRIQPPEWNVNGMAMQPDIEKTYYAQTTLPALLRKAGYRTLHAGKAHWGAKDTPGSDPCNLGFDLNIAGYYGGAPGSYYGTKNFSATWRDKTEMGTLWDVPDLEKYHGKDIYLTEALTIEANNAIEQAVSDGKPFYLYMSHYAVHAPWEADNRFVKRYQQAGLMGDQTAYASMIEGMDKSLGDIMANIRRLGIENDTIIVFMSDNGGAGNLPRSYPLRGHKLEPYEGGVRVPMIVKWPGVTKPDTVCREDYLIIEDIFPTFLEMAGVECKERIDGISFVPLLKGQSDISKGRSIFWHFPHVYGQLPYSAIRKDEWKLIYFHASAKLELYNLVEDIGEQNNLVEKEPAKVKELAKILGDHLRETGALMPTDTATKKAFPYPDKRLL